MCLGRGTLNWLVTALLGLRLVTLTLCVWDTVGLVTKLHTVLTLIVWIFHTACTEKCRYVECDVGYVIVAACHGNPHYRRILGRPLGWTLTSLCPTLTRSVLFVSILCWYHPYLLLLLFRFTPSHRRWCTRDSLSDPSLASCLLPGLSTAIPTLSKDWSCRHSKAAWRLRG